MFQSILKNQLRQGRAELGLFQASFMQIVSSKLFQTVLTIFRTLVLEWEEVGGWQVLVTNNIHLRILGPYREPNFKVIKK